MTFEKTLGNGRTASNGEGDLLPRTVATSALEVHDVPGAGNDYAVCRMSVKEEP